MATQKRNTMLIRFKNGIDGTMYLSTADAGILQSVAPNAPPEFARFQKKPIRNMANMPGVIKPVNSWM